MIHVEDHAAHDGRMAKEIVIRRASSVVSYQHAYG